MPDPHAPGPHAGPPATGAPGLDDFLCFSIYAAGHAFNRVYKPLLDPLGLTYPQYLVMVVLWEQDNQTVGGIGERLHLESSTLTPLLKRLEAMGHVTRSRDAADERVVRVRLTAEGKALAQRGQTIPSCLFAATGLSLPEVVRLQREVAALCANLERAAAPA